MISFRNNLITRRLIWLGIFVMLTMLVAACRPQPTETVSPPPTALPTDKLPEPTMTMRVEQADPLLNVKPVPIQQIWGIEWEWTNWIETQPSTQSSLPDPDKYQLVFNNDGTYLAKADCNLSSGSYQANDINLTLTPGPMTLAQCGPESLSNQYVGLLANVMAFGLSDGDLVLILNDNAGSLLFSNGGLYQPTPTSIPCTVGINISTVTLDLLGLPGAYQPNCVPGTPYDASPPTGPIGLPDHIQVNFETENPEDVGSDDPIIYILPVSMYEDLWIQSSNEAVRNSLAMLEGLLDIKLDPVPSSGLPILPSERVYGIADMQVQGSYLDITMGSGMRFVTRFVQTPTPVAKDDPQMYYTFQGFSHDGAYFIAFFYPVTTDKLSNAESITQEERDFVATNSQAYMNAKVTELNALEPSDWEPDLKQLDAVIKTLTWGSPTIETPSQDFAGYDWQWTSLVESSPAAQSVIPDPQNYTLRFASDGSLRLKADCNSGAGSYTTDGDSMTIQLGVLTKAACGPDSLSDKYLDLLAGVQNYDIDSDRLILITEDSGTRMNFTQGSLTVGEPTKTATLTPTSEGTPEPTSGPPEGALVAIILAPSEGQVNEQITFDGSDSIPKEDIISYEWDFGDGSPVTDGAKVEHNFTKPGIYTVSLRITSKDGDAADAFLDIAISE